jgi:DnaJ-class molecular chaperone
LQAELRAVDAKPPWSVLGISQGADLAEAKRAFFAASKRYHPHLYARYAAPEIKPVVTELFIVHKRAYTSLLKSAKSTRQSVGDHAAVQRELSKQPGSGNK